jgi:hypothetical protein
MRFLRFETTPNPNAIKCVIDPGPAPQPIRSYFKARQAEDADDALARDLFAIPGVTNVLIHAAFVTVGKSADAKWPPIRKGVRAAIERAGATDG